MTRRTRPGRVLGAVAFANLVVAMLHFGLAAAAPIVRREFSGATPLDASHLGALLAMPAVGLMLGTFTWGELADRFDERRVLASAFVGFTASCLFAAIAASHADPVSFGAALLLSGLCGSAAHSAGGRAISAVFPPERHGLVLAIRHTAIPIGGAIGGLVVPSVSRSAGFVPLLVGFGALGVVAAAGVAAALPRIAVGAAANDSAGPARSPLRDGRLWLLCVGCGCLAFVQLGVASFLTVQLVDEASLGIAIAAGIFTAAQLAGAAGRIVLGLLSDRLGRRVGVLRWVAFVALACVGGAVLATSARVEAALLVAALVVVTSCNGVAVAAAARLAPPGRTGATLGMQTTCNATACAIAPIALGLVLLAGGWPGFEAVLLAVLVASVACLAVLQRADPE